MKLNLCYNVGMSEDVTSEVPMPFIIEKMFIDFLSYIYYSGSSVLKDFCSAE